MRNWFDCFVEAGMGYGPGPAAISGYGFGFQGPPWAGGGMPDGSASRKRRGGDWIFLAQVSLNMICYDVCAIQFKYQHLVGIRMEHFLSTTGFECYPSFSLWRIFYV